MAHKPGHKGLFGYRSGRSGRRRGGSTGEGRNRRFGLNPSGTNFFDALARKKPSSFAYFPTPEKEMSVSQALTDAAGAMVSSANPIKTPFDPDSTYDLPSEGTIPVLRIKI